MPSLSIMEEMKDKASRLIPSPFTEVVEETTSEVLTAPDYEHIMFICDCANRKAENVVDVIRAVRRRIVNSSPKVQYFTVLLLDALVKNCYEDLHNEIADTKALQRELVNIAIKVPARDGEYEAKKCALTLILNMSYWFIGATCDKTKMLSKLADEVRDATNPLVFEDIESDPSFQLKRAPPNRIDPQQQQANRRRRVEQAAHTRPTSTGASRMNREPRIVNAIPVHQYEGDQISGMLDACSLLSECLNTAEEEARIVIGDEMIMGVAAEVRQEHAKLAMLITSGAQLENIDVLLTVSDSQTSIIERLETIVRAQSAQFQQPADNAQPLDERPPPQQATIVPPQQQQQQQQGSSSSVAATDNTTITQGTVQMSRRSGGLRQAHSVDKDDEGEEMVESPLAPHTENSINADQATSRQDPLDDFFSGSAAVPAPTEAPPADAPAQRAAPAPYQVMDPKVAVPEANQEEKSAVPAQPDDQDDFDAFLNNRLGSK